MANVVNQYGGLEDNSAFDAVGGRIWGRLDSTAFGGQWGYYTDTETGLILCTQRYYDPATHRWITRDPIGFSGGINLYGYVQNNPTNHVDPEGQQRWRFVPGLGRLLGPVEQAAARQSVAFGNFVEKLFSRSTPAFNPSARVEAQALMSQGLSRPQAFDAIRAFNQGSTTVCNSNFLFHFTNLKGGEAIVRSGGLRATVNGVSGPGVYTGTTPIPGFALRYLPPYGWGLNPGFSTRIPILMRPEFQNVTRPPSYGFPAHTRIIGTGESLLLRP